MGAAVEMEGNEFGWKGSSISEDPKAKTQLGAHKSMAWFAAMQVQDFAKTILRGEHPIEEWTDAQGSAALPTIQQCLEGILQEIVGQLK